MRDIVDEIDALVDDQLAAGEPVGGYETMAAAANPDPAYPECPHCGRHWHGLPITERIAAMYVVGEFDENYRVDTDDSRVLCSGSDFIGPMPAEGSTSGAPKWLDEIISTTMRAIQDTMEILVGGPLFGHRWGLRQTRWWRYQTPLGPATDAMAADIGGQFHRYTAGAALATWDYLGERPPDTGHTWEPLTAPGVTTHPSEGLTRVGPHPWDFEYTPETGQLVTFAGPHGTFTERIVDHSQDENTGEVTVTLAGAPRRRDRSGLDASRFLADLLADADLNVHVDLWQGWGPEPDPLHVENRLLPMRLEDV